MTEIIKGTTPTIKYTFDTVSVSNISTAVMTIKRSNTILVERDLTTATTDTDSISWVLSQEDTLAVDGKAEIMLNWKTADGVRGASKTLAVEFKPNHKESVL